MAMFSKYLASYLGFHLQPLAAATGVPRVILLKLLRVFTTVGNGKPAGYPEVGNVGNDPISEFLLNECGFCQTELSAILRRRPSLVATRSSHRTQQMVQLLRDSGLSEQQVRKTITRCPALLASDADQLLKPKIEFMKTLGFTAQDIENVIPKAPRVFNSSLEKTFFPNIQYLQNLFGSEANISNVFKWAPNLLAKSNGPDIFEKKLKHLVSFGLLEDEIKELVRRHPQILYVSMDKVQKSMNFFMSTAGLPPKFLLSHPNLVSCYSLERRIKPRHKVLSAVRAMQPSKRPCSLASAVSLNERKFLEKYVQSSPHATKLLEIYNGKPALF